MSRAFLEAEWRDLVVFNYELPPEILTPYLPEGLELDLWDGKALVSLVAFRFINTKVCGVRVPFHENFEEINLRFYVQRRTDGGPRRGVVFIKELVPRFAVAATARWLYHEKYFSVPMSHRRVKNDSKVQLEYSWTVKRQRQIILAEVVDAPGSLVPGSEAEFIFEHYWGYSRSRTGKTIEYEVTHRPWRVWTNPQVELKADLGLTYGDSFAEPLSRPWRSAFVAEGSEIGVYAGRIIGPAYRDRIQS